MAILLATGGTHGQDAFGEHIARSAGRRQNSLCATTPLQTHFEISHALLENGDLQLELHDQVLIVALNGQLRMNELPHEQRCGGPLVCGDTRSWRVAVLAASMGEMRAAVKS
jgi:hypothetical protein